MTDVSPVYANMELDSSSLQKKNGADKSVPHTKQYTLYEKGFEF